jgi:hypothetical protein
MKEALGFSETSVLTRATWRNIPEDTILHSHHRENLKSYTETILMAELDFHSLYGGKTLIENWGRSQMIYIRLQLKPQEINTK